MNTLNRVIIIWGALIFLYLLLANRSGTASLLNSMQNFATSTTRVLQGR